MLQRAAYHITDIGTENVWQTSEECGVHNEIVEMFTSLMKHAIQMFLRKTTRAAGRKEVRARHKEDVRTRVPYGFCFQTISAKENTPDYK